MKKILLMAAMVAGTAIARAQDVPPPAEKTSVFQLSLTPDIAIHPRSREIHGLSLNIWGENPQIGLSLGVVNGSTGDSKGLSWAVFNYDESYTGVQWGLANYSKESFKGWQGGIFFAPCLVNISHKSFTGLQEGVVNIADQCTGVQVGVVNYSGELHGVQVGLVNIARNNGWFDRFPSDLAKGFPIVNWSF